MALTGTLTAPWHLGTGRVPAPGTRVRLMLQGHTRGLGPAAPDHRPDPLPKPGPPIPGVTWAATYGDVLEVPDEVGAALDLLWDAPHSPGWVGGRHRDGARTLAGHLTRVLTAHR